MASWKRIKQNKVIKGLLIGGMIVLPFPLSAILLMIYLSLKKEKGMEELEEMAEYYENKNNEGKEND